MLLKANLKFIVGCWTYQRVKLLSEFVLTSSKYYLFSSRFVVVVMKVITFELNSLVFSAMSARYISIKAKIHYNMILM